MKNAFFKYILALLLFAVFAVCILSVLMAGAGAYRHIIDRDDSSHTQRTAAQYVSTKIRQADNPGTVAVEVFQGTQTLTLRQDLGGVVLLTQIYCYDGYLRELFHLEGSGLSPADGEKVLPMEDMSVELKDDLLSILLTASDGQQQRLFLSLRGREEALP